MSDGQRWGECGLFWNLEKWSLAWLPLCEEWAVIIFNRRAAGWSKYGLEDQSPCWTVCCIPKMLEPTGTRLFYCKMEITIGILLVRFSSKYATYQISGKESACQCRRRRFNPWVGKIPWRRKWQTTQYSCLGNLKDRRAWRATVHRGHKRSDMTEQLYSSSMLPTISYKYSTNVTLFYKVYCLQSAFTGMNSFAPHNNLER